MATFAESLSIGPPNPSPRFRIDRLAPRGEAGGRRNPVSSEQIRSDVSGCSDQNRQAEKRRVGQGGRPSQHCFAKTPRRLP
ncbi:UNVERIFIED_CONTAM: hypothetical protein GTU68_010274 [Idotea baltica]|nr:hypothetical protein [Idotea baltica]